jgi:hypothetical protein
MPEPKILVIDDEPSILNLVPPTGSTKKVLLDFWWVWGGQKPLPTPHPPN